MAKSKFMFIFLFFCYTKIDTFFFFFSFLKERLALRDRVAFHQSTMINIYRGPSHHAKACEVATTNYGGYVNIHI